MYTVEIYTSMHGCGTFLNITENELAFILDCFDNFKTIRIERNGYEIYYNPYHIVDMKIKKGK